MLTTKDPFEGNSKTIDLDGLSVVIDMEDKKEKENSKWGYIEDEEPDEEDKG